MKLSMIAAVGPNGEIGRGGTLPWPALSRDMKWFREHTTGKAVIMGRRTWESLPPDLRPLPERYNIVLSTTMPARAVGEPVPHRVARDMVAAIEAATPSGEGVVIGGARIYQSFLPLVEVIYLTKVDPIGKSGFDGCDAFFHHYPLPTDRWREEPAHDRWFTDEARGVRVGFFTYHRTAAT